MGKIGRLILGLVLLSLPVLATESIVAIHVSELTQALESAPAVAPTPTGTGTTGKEWWIPSWHYFVMPESVKEALRSDGTPFVIVTDADITAGALLLPDGKPRYPIVISLASEAIRDDEIGPLRAYVAAGGFLFVGSSAFTRRPNGTSRGDFALAAEMGLHTVSGDLENWVQENDMEKSIDHRLVSHITAPYLTWEMPLTSEDISWGISPDHIHQAYHDLWQVEVGDATEIAATSHCPYLLTKAYGLGHFIYHAGLQPLIGHGGHAPGMYAYGIFRKAIEWAFESANLPLIRVSPWRYAYNAAYMVRHDLENSQWAISNIEESALEEHSVGAKGDYYFCTGTLREEMENDPDVVDSIRRAVSLNGATIGSHNGGLKNPNNPDLIMDNYEYWHWGLDEALDTSPVGYPSGRDYAYASLVASFSDIDSWLTGLTTNKRTWVSPYFNSTRDASYEILEQAGVTAAGEQKLTPFPHWTLSTQTPGKHFSFLSLPASDWVVGERVRHGLDDGHDEQTIQALVDSYYDQGALVNLYSHNLSTEPLPNAYLLACAAKPAIWATNATNVTDWWTKRAPVHVTSSHTRNGDRLVVTAAVTGATDPQTAIEMFIPDWALASTGLQVKLNGAPANPSSFRTYHQGIKIKVGTTISTVEVSYPNGEIGVPPVITEGATTSVTMDEDNVPTAFALTLHATDADGDTLTWSIATAASHGTATGSGTGASKVIGYAPTSNYNGSDSFVVQVSDGNGGTAAITVNVTVNRVNDAPVNTVPLGQTVNEDTNLVFRASNGNLISTADIDVGETAGGNLQVALAVGHGQLTLSQVTGLTFTSGSNGSASMTVRGTASNINSALNGMTYRGDANYSGEDALSVTTSDLGNTGSGGALVDVDGVSITLTNLNDLPALAGAGNTLGYVENQSATPVCTTLTVNDPDDTTLESAEVLISANYANGQDVLGFVNTAKITGSWVPSTGNLALTRVTGQAPTLIEWRDALRSVTYFNSSNDPSTPSRQVGYRVNDGDGNSGFVISTITVAAVNDAPTVSGVTAASVGDVNAGGTTYDFTVTFTDDSAIAVSTLDNGDVYITTPAAGAIAATFISVDTPGNGTPRTATYRIVPPGGSWDVADNGTYTIGITGSQVGDASGAFVAADADIGTFAVALETVAPTVTNVTSPTPDGAYKAGQAITVQIAFSETVNVSGVPRLTLETGTADAVASYAGGSGSTTLAFLYTVTAGQETPDLDYVSAGALALNGGTIKDAAGNGATLTLPLPGSPGSLGANKAIIIDTTAPAAPSAPDLQAASDSGSLNTDNVTDDTTPTFDITGVEAGATVTLSSSVGGVIGTAEVGAGGSSCAITASTALAQGAHIITATQTDPAGNVSAASPAMAPNLYIAVSSTVTTQAATDITSISATGHGNIVALGVPNPTAHGVVWNTAGAPTLSDSFTNEGSASAAGDFTSAMTSLNPNAIYYVRAYATNNLLTTYGNEVSFSTLATYTLTIDSATGTVTRLPDQTTYEHGATVQLSASPATGYHFVNWSGDASGSDNPVTVTMDASKTISANFAIDSVPAAERDALIAFYDSTNGDNWTNNVGWKTAPLHTDGFAMPGTEGGWFGIGIDAGTLRVTSIFLSNNNLTGVIAPEVGSLSSLNFLGMSSNPIGGTIPAQIGNLANLTSIFLSGTQVGGAIPPELGNLHSLTQLYLSTGFITGSIPAEFGNLSNLVYLELRGNQLSGGIPANLGNLTSLQSVELSANQLTGSIPSSLGNLTNLTSLRLNGNQLSGPIPAELGNLDNLTELLLQMNDLTGSIPSELGGLASVQNLGLNHNELTGPIPASFGSLATLRNLSLEYNHLSGQIPSQLGSLANLQTLTLGANQLTGEIPSELGNLTSLLALYLNSNKLSGTIPASLAGLTNVSSLSLGYNSLVAADPDLIGFLNAKNPGWAATQTIAPTDVTATSLDNAVIMVSWLPVTYTADAGYFKVMISETLGGPYTLAGQTTDKATSAVNVTGLTPGHRYYFVVQTHTNAHANNQSALDSENSTEATAVAWTQTSVRIAGTVTLSGSPLAGVAMNGLAGNPLTNASGQYDVTVAAGWSGTVTPMLAGYTFVPASRTYTTVIADQAGQNYTATGSAQTVTVTSPNGGESWAAGSTHNITWTQTGLTGTVTIDLYKGEVWQKILGTPAATAETFSWTIASTEAAGTDYRVLVWQGLISDESEGDFALVRKFKVDFNKDGQEDFLWRCYGTGNRQGDNVVWFMTQTEGLSPVILGGAQNMTGAMNLMTGSTPGKTYLNPMDVGNVRTSGPGKSYISPMDVGNPQTIGPIKTLASPLDAGNRENTRRDRLTKNAEDSNGSLAQVNSLQTRTKDSNSDSVLQDAERLSAGDIGLMALNYSEAVLYKVLDTAWEIAGAGDFDGDGNTDVLWRYYGVGQGQGTTIIWYMNGTTVTGQGYPCQVSDTDWRIDRTGDFNGDGKTDILWRYYGSGGGRGTTIVWCMDGANIIGQFYPPQVWDTDWQIEGIGDFNGDGRADLLWRYYGTGPGSGTTIIWYMDGIAIIGQDRPTLISDTDWRVDTTGDFNRDGKADIVWRYHGTGPGLGTTIIWHMDGAMILGQDRPYWVQDLNWRIVNR